MVSESKPTAKDMPKTKEGKPMRLRVEFGCTGSDVAIRIYPDGQPEFTLFKGVACEPMVTLFTLEKAIKMAGGTT